MSVGLDDALAAFIRGEGGEFSSLALRLFRRQLQDNPQYGAIVEGRGRPVNDWRDIPAVPVALWRDLELSSFPAEHTATVFRTSGTTGRRGVVRRRDTRLYDLGSKRFAEQVVGPIPEQGVSLVPDAADSSLGHMVRSFAPRLRQRFTAAGGVDVAGAWSDLTQLSGPVFLPGTALALAALVGAATEPVALAPGSVVMVTGGFKGRQVSVTPARLRSELLRLLPGAQVVEEYGMTELSSQMWAPGPAEPLQLPPWLRVVPVDPATGAPVTAGSGLLRFVDLANADTVLAIETRDMGRLLPDGRLVLEGRLPGSPARGCSLSVEEATLGTATATGSERWMDTVGTAATRLPSTPTPGRGEASQAPAPEVPAPSADDRARVQAILAALLDLPPSEASWGQGLHPEAVAAEVSDAIARLRPSALLVELATVPPHRRPSTVAIVEAEGVFTAGLEWVVLALAAGLRVRWKPPRRWPDFAAAVGERLGRAGLPLTVSADRTLEDPDVVVVFGSDATVAQVAEAHSGARVVGFGHRFSIAAVQGPPSEAAVSAVVTDHLRFDTRGCMAPTAVFVEGPISEWGRALHSAMAEWDGPPRGAFDARLGPEWRRRVDLGHATLGAWVGASHAVVAVPADAWVPSAMPRMVTLVPVQGDAHLAQVVGSWQPWLSSVAGTRALAAPRLCALGQLQSPAIPRLHDGRPMLASICGLEA